MVGCSRYGEDESTERALALVEALLDRYGVIAQPLIDKEDIPVVIRPSIRY